ncbi:natterin-4-like [Megalobrama amblycephala]|uniref:natterin-4-like n=1 Tax=Megalobrama amblycephala TaxID=75352 RepID=UPI0020145D40|nr:natterin-4-like [Megalobrama amblycephala]
MMGFSVIIIFALLQIRLLNAGGNPEDLSNIESTDSSNHHQRHARGSPSSKPSAGKEEEDQNFFDSNIYLELVESNTPPKDAVKVSHLNQENYIIVNGKCNNVKYELLKSSAAQSQGANNKVRQFLVNKDNFEILKWKTWADIQNGQIQFYPVRICKSHYIAKDQNGITSIDNLVMEKSNENMQTEVLTVNFDISWEHLEIDNYVVSKEKTDKNSDVIKQFIAHNNNCAPAKHVVKLDQGSDKTSSFLNGRGHTFGVGGEVSISGKIPQLFDLGGKINLKYDHSRSKSITTSKVDKVLHSVSTEIQVPPNTFCTIEISSKTFRVQVPYTGQLIRRYKGDNLPLRITSVTGIYDYQEVAELETSVNSCKDNETILKCTSV